MVDAKDAGILKSPIKVVVAKFVSMSDKKYPRINAKIIEAPQTAAIVSTTFSLIFSLLTQTAK